MGKKTKISIVMPNYNSNNQGGKFEGKNYKDATKTQIPTKDFLCFELET